MSWNGESLFISLSSSCTLYIPKMFQQMLAIKRLPGHRKAITFCIHLIPAPETENTFPGIYSSAGFFIFAVIAASCKNLLEDVVIPRLCCI
ncbi:MAG: hypothetical protein JWR61_2273 [Ferruginibacter sp.]|nr:hypothetical protein [Ferruginibacter sp.]